MDPEEDEIDVSVPDFENDLPLYFPMHLSLRVNTEFAQVQLVAQINDRMAAVRKTTESFIEYIVENSHLLQDPQTLRFLGAQIDVYTRLARARYRLHALQSTLKTAHRTFLENRRDEQNLSLSNLYVYKDVVKENFADSIIAKLDSETHSEESVSAMLAGDAALLYISNAKFVLDHPEDPLPDDLADDDVAISGGKISLKDPLSLNYFVDPVLSRKCQHVYEKEHIFQLLEAQLPLDCPVTGCAARLLRADLREDKLMALRVKVHLARTKKRDQQAIRI